MREKQMLTTSQLYTLLQHEQRKIRYKKTLSSTVLILISVAATAVLIATLLFPVLYVTGASMEPTLENGDVTLALKTTDFERGDIVAFYYNNKILLKRVIALPGDYISMEDDGTVIVNGEKLEEPYLHEKSIGQCDLIFPYQVPENRVFVMGDHRKTSVDSRTTDVGCIADEFIVGKVIARFWPMDKVGIL